MKKVIAIVLALILLIAFSGCNNQSVVTYSARWGRNNVYEKSTYKVSVAQSDEMYINSPRLFGEGEYVSIISGSNDNGYTVESSLNFVGYYEMPDGSKKDINDVVKTIVKFSNAGNSFKPIESKREYNGTTISYENGGYVVSPLNFESKVTYGEKKINLSTISKDGKEIPGIKGNIEIKKPKGVYFDNEQVIYGLRSMISEDVSKNGLYTSFSLISGASDEALPISAQILKGQVVTVSTNINGEKKDVDAYNLSLIKTGKKSGATLVYTFIKDDLGEVNSAENKITVDRARCVRFTQNVPYTNDYLVYELVSYNYGE